MNRHAVLAVLVLMLAAGGIVGLRSHAQVQTPKGSTAPDYAGLTRRIEGWQRWGKEDEPRLIRELSNWGRWAKADEVGAINLITPEKKRQAAALVKAGVSVSLAELQVPNVDDPKGLYAPSKPYGMALTFP